MLAHLVVTAALALHPGTPQDPALAPSKVARIVVKPAQRTMAVGDTLRLTAEAFDASGKSVPAQFLYRLAGGRFEASVDSTGLVKAGATSTIAVSVGELPPTAMIRFVSASSRAWSTIMFFCSVPRPPAQSKSASHQP